MRIAMIIARYPPESAGAEIQCQRLSATLVGRGHDVTVLTENRRPGLPYEEVENGVRIIRMPTTGNPPWSSFVFALKLLKFFLKNPSFDVLHAHLIAMPAMFAIFWGRFAHTPVLVKTGGAGPTGDVQTSKNLRRGRFKLSIFKRGVHSIVAPSGRARLELLDIGVKDSQIHVIPNGVDFKRFTPPSPKERQKAREILKLPPQDPIAIFTGRWVHGKNVELLLDAWEYGLRDPNFNWKLLLVIGGSGIPSGARQRLNTLAPSVTVQENPRRLIESYHAADLAVLLSIGEGISNFLLEAMACRLPTLTSESASITTAPERERWGWVMEDASLTPKRIADFLRDQAQKPEGLGMKGQEGRRQVEAGYSLEATAQAYETLYRHCIRHVAV